MRRHLSTLRTLLPTLTSAAIAAGCAASVDSGDAGRKNDDLATTDPARERGTGTKPTETTTPPKPPEPRPVALNLCSPAGDGLLVHDLLEGVTRGAGATDYFELRDGVPPGWGTGAPIVLASSGTKCATATDKDACEAKLAEGSAEGWMPVSFGMEPGPRHRYLVWNAGDAVGAATSLEGLRALLGPAENAKDAALLAVATSQYRVRCDVSPNAKQTASGWELEVESGHTCGAGAKREGHRLAVSSTGEITVLETTLLEEGNPGCAIGRRPEGLLVGDRTPCDDSVGRFFAEAACLEAASVEAFDRLAIELGALGAPVELIEAARSSRADEVRHARMTARMARRFGAEPRPALIEAANERTRLAIALENAVEGCVRETFGALVAHHQAAEASDRSIAAMMSVIAEDETKHAALAWDIASWLEPQLSASERAEVTAARTRAIEALRGELSVEPAADLRDRAGMPDAPRASLLLELLEDHFISPAIA